MQRNLHKHVKPFVYTIYGHHTMMCPHLSPFRILSASQNMKFENMTEVPTNIGLKGYIHGAEYGRELLVFILATLANL